MTPLFDAGQARKDSQDTFALVRLSYGTEPYKHMADWLAALAAEQQVYMASCAKDRLGDAQVRLKHLQALHSALTAREPASAGHVFD